MNVEPIELVTILKLLFAILATGFAFWMVHEIKNAPEMDDEGNFIYPKDKLKDL